MEFKFNPYNEDYIMIARFNILMAIAHFESIKNKNADEIEIFKTFIDIQNSINTYERNMIKKKIFYTNMFEITINKDSKLGQYILANQTIPEYITLDDIIHALLVCINRNNWQYYEQIAKLIKKFKEENCVKIDYNSFRIIAGEEITNNIINSKSYRKERFRSDKNVYLYQKNKIINTELPEPAKTDPKTRTKTK